MSNNSNGTATAQSLLHYINRRIYLAAEHLKKIDFGDSTVWCASDLVKLNVQEELSIVTYIMMYVEGYNAHVEVPEILQNVQKYFMGSGVSWEAIIPERVSIPDGDDCGISLPNWWEYDEHVYDEPQVYDLLAIFENCTKAFIKDGDGILGLQDFLYQADRIRQDILSLNRTIHQTINSIFDGELVSVKRLLETHPVNFD